MNIFKVLASGKKSFQEETASAILAWLLNPSMEHGLGCIFTSKFFNAVSSALDNQTKQDQISRKLVTKLRNRDENQLKLWIDLEYKVENADIDIVIEIEEVIIAIENKIYASSSTEGQLEREYKGLCEKFSDSIIGMIYLVPISENNDILDAKIENHYNNLEVKEDHFKSLVTWQKNSLNNIPSIVSIIEDILEDEHSGNIDPISEYTRHTLKALKSFISNEFNGYSYEKNKSASGKYNILTEENLLLDDIKKRNTGFVGVQYDIGGLLRMNPDEIKNYKFQYTSQNMENKKNWIKADVFISIASWLIDKHVREIQWNGKFASESLYKIASSFGDKVFIGIKGGVKTLKSLSFADIQKKSWSISTEKSTNQWINGKLFCEVYKEKIDSNFGSSCIQTVNPQTIIGG